MNKLNYISFIIIFCLLIFSCKKNSDDVVIDGEVLNTPSNISGKNLFSISEYQSDLFIAGDGCLLKSTDNGTNWTEMFSDNSVLFFDVKFCNSNIGYAVGYEKSPNSLNKKALLYKSTDGGSTWTQIFKEASRASSVSTFIVEGKSRNGGIAFLDESRLIWGVGNTVYYSVTGGRANHWTGSLVSAYSAVFPNLDKGFFGSSGYLESLYGGVRFGAAGPQSFHCFDLDLISQESIVACGKWAGTLEPEILKIGTTSPNDYSYKVITGAAVSDEFYGVDFLDDNIGYIVGSGGKIFFTNDGGDNWIQTSSFTTEQLNDILFYSSTEAIIIGNNGTLIRLNSDAHENISIEDPKLNYNETETTWNTINTGTTNDFYEVEVKSGNVFVVGDGLILKSTNQGETFNSVYANSNYEFRDVSFVDANTGWVIGYNNSSNQVEVLKTSNGGSSWNVQTSLNNSCAENEYATGLVVSALNSNYVLASSDCGFSNKKFTTDGINWQAVGGNFAVAEISDFLFYGNDFSSVGFQGFGSMLGPNGGSYFAQNIQTGAAGTTQGCTAPDQATDSPKAFGMNAICIEPSGQILAMARDKEQYGPTDASSGWFERTKGGNPLQASDWTCRPTYTRANFYGLTMLSSTEIWMCGENGVVITTKGRSGGLISESSAPEPQKEWYGHETGVYSDLFDIDHVNQDIFIAVGADGTIIRTTNGNAPSMVIN
ncbi:MAG: hypothetical protein CL846_01260 [Crocinitomicaceae bacterium]|nr:hypothetical protein [Crocinitomicaceae bacterium]|tara:strand:+ start:1000 stop:3135 length:2136 start_codon:yes stop_codon:yes gene_type:complete